MEGLTMNEITLLQMVEELKMDVNRLEKENADLKGKYDINITEKEMEKMYKEYYSCYNL